MPAQSELRRRAATVVAPAEVTAAVALTTGDPDRQAGVVLAVLGGLIFGGLLIAGRPLTGVLISGPILAGVSWMVRRGDEAYLVVAADQRPVLILCDARHNPLRVALTLSSPAEISWIDGSTPQELEIAWLRYRVVDRAWDVAAIRRLPASGPDNVGSSEPPDHGR